MPPYVACTKAKALSHILRVRSSIYNWLTHSPDPTQDYRTLSLCLFHLLFYFHTQTIPLSAFCFYLYLYLIFPSHLQSHQLSFSLPCCHFSSPMLMLYIVFEIDSQIDFGSKTQVNKHSSFWFKTYNYFQIWS